jgi:hypothetical protein
MRRPFSAVLPAMLGLTMGALAPPSSSADAAPPKIVVAADRQPDIVLITADDMAASDLAYMPRTRRLLG